MSVSWGKTLQELKDTAGCYQKLYQLLKEVGQDLPPSEHWHAPEYDDFLRDLSKCSPQCYFIAVYQDNYVGLSYLTEHTTGNYCGTCLTGVRRNYRHKGIALLLKLRGTAFARQKAYTSIRTSVDSSNRASLAMNERLGFVRQLAWIVFTKSVRG
jgi:mycothiol synthase